jgi:hypothetical protein
MNVLLTRVILEGLVPLVSGVLAYEYAKTSGYHPLVGAAAGLGVACWIHAKASFDAKNLFEHPRQGDVGPDDSIAFVASWIALHAFIPLAAFGGYGIAFYYQDRWLVALGAATLAAWCVAALVRHHYEGTPSDFVRGAVVKSLVQMRKEAAKKLPPGDPGLPFGGVMLPSHRANAHFCFIGSPGSGKSVSIQRLMQQAFPAIGAGKHHRAVVFDSKLDVLPQLEGLGLSCPIRTLNPLDARGFAWAISRDITTRAHAAELVEVLFPANPKASQPFFDEAKKALCEAVVVSFLEHSPGAWTLRDVVSTLLSPERIEAVLGRTAEGRETFARYFANEKTANDVMSTIANGVNHYMIVASLWHHAEREGRALSLKEFVESESILVVGRSQVAGKALKHINQVIVQRLIQLILEKGNHAQVDSLADRTWFVLDEFKALGRLRGIEDLLTMGRSAGACVVLGFQDWRGLCAVYEENEAHELVGLCAHKAFLRLDGKETARFASESIGNVEWYEESTGPSGPSRSIQSRTRVLANAFRELPKTSVAAGLHGYYMSDEDVWFAPLRGPEVFRDLARPAVGVPGLLERAPGDQRLMPLASEDFERLEITLERERERETEREWDHDQEQSDDLGYEPEYQSAVGTWQPLESKASPRQFQTETEPAMPTQPRANSTTKTTKGRIAGLGRFRLRDKDTTHEREGPG